MAASMTSISKNQTKPNFTFSLDTPSLSSGTLDKYLKSVLGEDSQSAIPDILKGAGQSSENLLGRKDSLDGLHGSGDHDKHPAHSVPITSTTPSVMGGNIQSQPTSVSPAMVHPHQDMLGGESHGQQLATTTNDNNELIPVPRGQNYVDITEYLNMPQADAAKKLGIPPSTLSKRWKEAVRKRKWPYRMICKIDKEIMTLLHNVPQGPNAPPLPEEIETALGISLRKRQEELRPVVIRI